MNVYCQDIFYGGFSLIMRFYWAKHQSFQPFQLIMHLTEVHHERDFKNANANAKASMGTLNPFGGFLRLVGEG